LGSKAENKWEGFPKSTRKLVRDDGLGVCCDYDIGFTGIFLRENINVHIHS
jgi:hypothetical protein